MKEKAKNKFLYKKASKRAFINGAVLHITGAIVTVIVFVVVEPGWVGGSE